MSLLDFQSIIRQAKEIGVLQIALGGGNPNQHPDFIEILKMTRDNGIVPSYTTNGHGLTDKVLKATKKYCGAIAVSAYKPYENLFDIINVLYEYGIKTNIHFLVSSITIKDAIDWLNNPPIILNNINAIVFLNYKPINTSFDHILRGSNQLRLFFNLIKDKKYKFKIGFDSCFISGIVSNLKINSFYIDSCDSARFSAFISEDMKMYPCSFMINMERYGDLKNDSIKSIWEKNELFKRHRNLILGSSCNSCSFEQDCKGGCVFIPDINLCN